LRSVILLSDNFGHINDPVDIISIKFFRNKKVVIDHLQKVKLKVS
jgi:hypothetical protein